MKLIRGMMVPGLVALAIGAVVCAPSAAADGNGFLNELRANNGQLPGKTATEMVIARYQTCSELSRGASVPEAASAVEQRYGISDGTVFVNAATTNICPDFAG